MAWTYILIASLFEITWAIGLKYSQGFSKLYPSIITIIAMGLSVYFLALGVKSLPIGTAYAIWTGTGAAGTAILGMILFNEPADILRVLCILLIVAGIVGLKLLSGK